MLKTAHLLALTCLTLFAVHRVSDAQTASKKADKKLVTPGVGTSKTGKKPGEMTAPTAFVRVLHAVPNGPKIDVFDGSLQIADNRGFTGISDYLPVRVGKSTIKVLNAGTNAPLITSESFNFRNGKYYTVALYGKNTPVLVSIDESRGKDNLEKARVRVVHLAPGAPELMVTAPSTHNDAGYMKLAPKPLKYGKMASKLTPPRETTIQVRTLEGKLLRETPTQSFDADKRYTAFIIGDITDTKDLRLDVLIKLSGELEKAAP